jgi:hypothetical protein
MAAAAVGMLLAAAACMLLAAATGVAAAARGSGGRAGGVEKSLGFWQLEGRDPLWYHVGFGVTMRVLSGHRLLCYIE